MTFSDLFRAGLVRRSACHLPVSGAFLPSVTDKTVLSAADKLFSAALYKRLSDKGRVFLPVILQKRSLHQLFAVVVGTVHVFAGKRVDPRVVHDG